MPHESQQWDVPVEIVMACLNPALKTVVYSRSSKGEHPNEMAKIVVHNRRFFGLIFFGGNGTDLYAPLDAWPFTLEIRS